MSTYTDGPAPAVTPGPDDEPGPPRNGFGAAKRAARAERLDRAERDRERVDRASRSTDSVWLHTEIQRRIAESKSGSVPRHARHSSSSSGSTGYVPRHATRPDTQPPPSGQPSQPPPIQAPLSQPLPGQPSQQPRQPPPPPIVKQVGGPGLPSRPEVPPQRSREVRIGTPDPDSTESLPIIRAHRPPARGTNPSALDRTVPRPVPAATPGAPETVREPETVAAPETAQQITPAPGPVAAGAAIPGPVISGPIISGAAAEAVAPDQSPADQADLSHQRVRVILAERKRVARPVRTVVDIQEGTGVGELLRANLIDSQLAVALRFAIGTGLLLGLLPLLFALFPQIGQIDVLGLRVPWLVLGLLIYPLLVLLGWWHTHTAERVEQDFADHVQD